MPDELPPPNPADWICGADFAELVTTPADGPWTPPQRHAEPMTWDVIRAARPFWDYEPRHAA